MGMGGARTTLHAGDHGLRELFAQADLAGEHDRDVVPGKVRQLGEHLGGGGGPAGV